MTAAEPERLGEPAVAAGAVVRVPVRAKSQGLVAYQVTVPADIVRVDGRSVHAEAGDYVITRGAHTLDVLSPQRFQQAYERIDSGLALTRGECTRLEQTLGVGATTAGVTLAQAVERLALLTIGEVRLDFTPGQLAELKHRATKRGQTIEQTIRHVVDRIQDELFHQGG